MGAVNPIGRSFSFCRDFREADSPREPRPLLYRFRRLIYRSIGRLELIGSEITPSFVIRWISSFVSRASLASSRIIARCVSRHATWIAPSIVVGSSKSQTEGGRG